MAVKYTFSVKYTGFKSAIAIIFMTDYFSNESRNSFSLIFMLFPIFFILYANICCI